MDYKVFITTSGIGSRLGSLTKHTNKSLVRIGKKPTLSYIIETYPKNVPLVISVGYYAENVMDFVKLAYPDRNVTFVTVDKYEGEGSSLAYSMLCAKDELACPFVYHACDTIIKGAVPAPEFDYIMGYGGDDSSHYASFSVQGDYVAGFHDKGADNFDLIHIGLVGIKNHAEFWNQLSATYAANPEDASMNDVTGITAMMRDGYKFRHLEIPEWLDIGNTKALEHARKTVADAFDNLEKNDESIYLFNDFVIKFFADPSIVRKRVERAGYLDGMVPKISESTERFYKYSYVEGELYSHSVNEESFPRFLEWAKGHIFRPISNINAEKFHAVCLDFYKTKTEKRLADYYAKYNFTDTESIINGIRVPKLSEILSQVDFEWLSNGSPSVFHGDFHFENIIEQKNGFKLLDWRQDFWGITQYGDVYYDLAKLNHGMIVNHDMVRKNLFSVDASHDESVRCDIVVPYTLVKCQKAFMEFLEHEKYDIKKVQILTNLIFLNIAVLHHHPYDEFLYFFGKLGLYNALKE